jgi:hypothetical protein
MKLSGRDNCPPVSFYISRCPQYPEKITKVRIKTHYSHFKMGEIGLLGVQKLRLWRSK